MRVAGREMWTIVHDVRKFNLSRGTSLEIGPISVNASASGNGS